MSQDVELTEQEQALADDWIEAIESTHKIMKFITSRQPESRNLSNNKAVFARIAYEVLQSKRDPKKLKRVS